jgi:hypothetical protein
MKNDPLHPPRSFGISKILRTLTPTPCPHGPFFYDACEGIVSLLPLKVTYINSVLTGFSLRKFYLSANV